jgi:uncharacterized protein YoxC
MESIVKSDLFFFISSISVCLITVVIIIAGYYVIKTLRNVADISETVKRTAHSAEVEIGEISERVTDSALFRFVFGRKKRKKEIK